MVKLVHLIYYHLQSWTITIALQPRKWQLTGNDCSTAAQAEAAHSPR